MNSALGLVMVALVGLSSVFASASPMAPCLDAQGKSLPVNNAQIVTWKHSTPNQFMARAHAAGVIAKIYDDRNGHDHFQIILSQTANETLEVVYNQSFGSLPALAPGMKVDTCGDYITASAAANGYQPSPDGAIIHWVHQSDSRNHASGYVEINNNLFGHSPGRGGN